MAPDHEIFELGAVTLQSGDTLPDAKLAYKTYGSLNARGDNVIVMPTFYTGTHVHNEGYLRAVPALDPSRYFIVSIDMFGNGLSSSPSNTAAALRRPALPRRHPLRQCRLPEPAAHQGSRRDPHRPRAGMVHGRMPVLSVGRAVPRHGRCHPALLCLGADVGAQHGVPRRGEGGAHGRRRVRGRRLQRAARGGAQGIRAGLCGMGVFADLLSRSASSRAWLRDLGGAAPQLGARPSRMGRQRPAGQAPHSAPGSWATSAWASVIAAISSARSAPSARARSWFPARPISTSRPRTTPSRPSSCPTRSFGPTPRSGATAWRRRAARAATSCAYLDSAASRSCWRIESALGGIPAASSPRSHELSNVFLARGGGRTMGGGKRGLVTPWLLDRSRQEAPP